jgi:hypothetical protein
VASTTIFPHMNIFTPTQMLKALRQFFGALPDWYREQYQWALLALPLIWGGAVFQLAAANAFGWKDPANCHALMEIVHPGVLAVGSLVGLIGWFSKRDPSLMFLVVMLMFVLAREIGGQGTSVILYCGLVLLISYSYSNWKKLATLLESRMALSLMATGFICYLVSQLFDRGVIKRIGWLFTWDTSWKPAYSTQIEESLEALGGCFLLASVVVTLALAFRAAKPGVDALPAARLRDEN